MPERPQEEDITEHADPEHPSLAEKARERRLRALIQNNREMSNIFL